MEVCGAERTFVPPPNFPARIDDMPAGIAMFHRYKLFKSRESTRGISLSQLRRSLTEREI
jgi:hypothetical protein